MDEIKKTKAEAEELKSSFEISTFETTANVWTLDTMKVAIDFDDLVNKFKGKVIFSKAKFGFRVPRKRKKLVKRLNILHQIHGFDLDIVRKHLKFYKKLHYPKPTETKPVK